MDKGHGGVLQLFLRLLRRFKVPGSVSTIGLRWREVVMRRLDSNPLILGLLFRLAANRCDDLEYLAHERSTSAVVWCCPGVIK
jgi:hypothetical protein